VRWWTLAADQGDADAQHNLALMYYNGQGVVQDYKKATHWYTQAAEQGLAEAQNNLGLMYANGRGVVQDNIRAHMWMNIAAANGATTAPKNRDIAAAKMSPQQIERAQQMARECMSRNYKRCN
jgi:TPR repeat protein